MLTFLYHPKAQEEFDLILGHGDPELEISLGLAVARYDRIYDGTMPLSNGELLGRGHHRSSLYHVEYTASLVHWVDFIYEELNGDVLVLAIDATRLGLRFFNPAVHGDAEQRARSRSSR